MTLQTPPRLSGTNLERAADHNQRVTLHAIRLGGSLTRIDLARITGLTGPAIANITRRLLQEGMIEEAGQRRGGRAPRARREHPHPGHQADRETASHPYSTVTVLARLRGWSTLRPRATASS